MSNLKTYQLFLLLFLLFLIIIIYIPMLNAGYAFTDDMLMLKSSSGRLQKISLDYILNTFKSCHEGLYHPLVTLSYSTELTFFYFIPDNFIPVIFHFDNILLHLANILLVFLILFKLSKSFWLSFIVASLFAIHPTRVEVVAWISARKDLLYSFFYLLSIWFYIKTYSSNKKKVYLTLSVIMFLFSCFSKAMAITLPFVLILIDSYTNNFNKQKLKIYLLYIFATLSFSSINIYAHYFTNYNDIDIKFTTFDHFVNFINAHFNILFYLDKLVLPIKLYLTYPYFYDQYSMLPPTYILYSPAILYILVYLSFLSLRKTKVIFYGFLFFLITILPSSSILPIGNFSVADRYTYITYLGLFFIFAKTIIYICNKSIKYMNILTITLCMLIFISFNYLSYIRVIDWQQNRYCAPIKMKYYKFGINIFNKRII